MKFYKNVIVIWTVVYFSIAFIGRFTSYNKEIYPFFRWSLYSKTPNQIEFPFVLVSKIGDSIFNPTNILELKSIHHVSDIDMNLNVSNFYGAVKNEFNQEQIEETRFLEILPKGSSFELLVKKIDLSKLDFQNTVVVKKVCVVQNNKIVSFE